MKKTETNETKALERLRLPELQAKFAEVTGEKSRSPNRAFLIRRITEALAAQETVPASAADAEAKPATQAQEKAEVAATEPLCAGGEYRR